MRLSEKIKSNPYLKPSNCTDLADIEYAIDCLHKLDKEFGSDNKQLLTLWRKFLDKKKAIEAKEAKADANLHPIFAQALKGFIR